MSANPKLLLFFVPIVGILCVAKAIHLKATSMSGSIYDAAAAGDIHQLKLHLNAHEPINTPDPTGVTPLSASLPHPEATKFLLEHGALANLQADRSETPLMLAAATDNAAAIDVLVQHKAWLEVLSPDGATALSIAAISGNKSAEMALLRHGADPNTRNQVGVSPLHYAVATNEIDLINALLAAGANINAKTNIGMTPLGRAVLNGRIEAAELLLKRGAKTDVEGYTLMHFAALTGAMPMQLKLVIEPHLGREVSRDVAMATRRAYRIPDPEAEKRSTSMIPLLLKYGIPLETLSKDGYSPLQLAVLAENLPAVKALLRAGAKPDAKNKRGETAVSLARQQKDESVLGALLNVH
jgi:uncharacterized protein